MATDAVDNNEVIGQMMFEKAQQAIVAIENAQRGK